MPATCRQKFYNHLLFLIFKIFAARRSGKQFKYKKYSFVVFKYLKYVFVFS